MVGRATIVWAPICRRLLDGKQARCRTTHFQRNEEAGLVWDEEKLDRFIANPDQVVPGNDMKPFGGLSSSDDRKKIIAFLAQQQ